MSLNHLLRMAEYNIWATARLVQALEPVSIDDFNKDMGLFFKSISGTLNHLLLGEHYLWYPRFKEGISPSIPLDTIVHTDKHILLRELRQKTLNWSSFIKQLDDRILDGKLSYRTNIRSAVYFTLFCDINACFQSWYTSSWTNHSCINAFGLRKPSAGFSLYAGRAT